MNIMLMHFIREIPTIDWKVIQGYKLQLYHIITISMFYSPQNSLGPQIQVLSKFHQFIWVIGKWWGKVVGLPSRATVEYLRKIKLFSVYIILIFVSSLSLSTDEWLKPLQWLPLAKWIEDTRARKKSIINYHMKQSEVAFEIICKLSLSNWVATS